MLTAFESLAIAEEEEKKRKEAEKKKLLADQALRAMLELQENTAKEAMARKGKGAAAAIDTLGEPDRATGAFFLFNISAFLTSMLIHICSFRRRKEE